MRAVLVVMAGVLAVPASAAPVALACTAEHGMSWQAGTPELVAMADDENSIGGPPVFHVDPNDGEWFLEIPGSSALTSDGGTFEIVRASAFERYNDEWVGLDQDTMLRVRGGEEPYPFLFVSRDFSVVTGTCVAPEKPFLLLQDP